MAHFIVNFSFSKYLFYLLISSFLISCSDDPEPFVPVLGNSEFELYINEIKAVGDPDWVEIYNPGTDPVDLEGFFIFDDNRDRYQIPGGLVIPAQGYLIFFCDGLAFANHTNFRLSANGEQVVLMDPDQNVVDFIEYEDIDDNQVLARFPDGSDNLSLSGSSTQELSNGAGPTALLDDLMQDPLVPLGSENVTISIEAIHPTGQNLDMQLIYRVDEAAFDTLSMNAINDSTYQAQIPATNADAVVDYYVSAVDQNELFSTSPYDAPDLVLARYIIDSSPLPELLINEFLASNNSCCPDRITGTDEFNDWFEIYNAGTVPVDIGGFHLSDDPLDPFRYQVPTDDPTLTTIPAGGYLLVWADGDAELGPLHTNFRLSADGEHVIINSFDGRTIDAYEFGIQTTDVSEGRSPNGSATWQFFNTPTPGSVNP